jgi:methylmalonyl-CoA/ethylmalonyl-CoA epimerase
MLNKIHHIGIAVRHIDECVALYRDGLGLPVTKDAVLEEQGVRGVLLSAGETELELLEPLKEASPIGRFIETHGEGLHHLCFGSDAIEADLADAKSKGLQLIDELPRPGLAGRIAFLHPKATRGVLVEYAQPPDGEGQAGPGIFIKKFDHLAVAFSDIEAGIQTFTNNFGLRAIDRRDLPLLGIRASTLPIGESWIGIVTPRSPDTDIARFMARRGEGLYLISLAVKDLDGLLRGLEQQKIGSTDPVSPRDGTRLAFLSPKATHGVLIQLIEQAA